MHTLYMWLMQGSFQDFPPAHMQWLITRWGIVGNYLWKYWFARSQGLRCILKVLRVICTVLYPVGIAALTWYMRFNDVKKSEGRCSRRTPPPPPPHTTSWDKKTGKLLNSSDMRRLSMWVIKKKSFHCHTLSFFSLSSSSNHPVLQLSHTA